MGCSPNAANGDHTRILVCRVTLQTAGPWARAFLFFLVSNDLRLLVPDSPATAFLSTQDLAVKPRPPSPSPVWKLCSGRRTVWAEGGQPQPPPQRLLTVHH